MTNRSAGSSIESESLAPWPRVPTSHEAAGYNPARRRDELEELVAQFQGPLLRYAGRMLSDGERAQDIVQEAFLRWLRKPPAATEAPRIGAWLYRVTHNLCIDALRTSSRRERLKDSIARPDSAPDPTASLIRKEAWERFEGLLEKLNENQRAVITLFFQEGMTYKEIAGITELSVSNVGMSLQRGLKRLRGMMDKEEFI